MKTTRWFLVLAVLCSVLSVPVIAADNWKHKKSGTSEFSKNRMLTMELDNMAGGGAYTEASHRIVEDDYPDGVMMKQWARAYYKLSIPGPFQLGGCAYFEYIGDVKSDGQIYTWIKGYRTQSCDINLLGAHQYKSDNDAYGATIYDVGGTNTPAMTIVFQWSAKRTGGVQATVAKRTKTQIHENATHNNRVRTAADLGIHCTNDCPCKQGNIETTTLCNTCLTRLRQFVHVDSD